MCEKSRFPIHSFAPAKQCDFNTARHSQETRTGQETSDKVPAKGQAEIDAWTAEMIKKTGTTRE